MNSFNKFSVQKHFEVAMKGLVSVQKTKLIVFIHNVKVRFLIQSITAYWVLCPV